jgi:hypothetical protein
LREERSEESFERWLDLVGRQGGELWKVERVKSVDGHISDI